MALVALSASAQVNYSPFKHYTDKVDYFERQPDIDSTDIVILGNSLTEYGGDWSKLLRRKHVANRGIAGDDAMGIYQRLNQITQYHPKAIFLMVGINDLSHNLTPEQVFSEAERVIVKIRHDSPKTKLFVQSILPINESFDTWKTLAGKTDDIPRINNLLKIYCGRHKIAYINLFPNFVRHGTNILRKELTVDGLHLTSLGYKIWSYELRNYLHGL